MGTAQGLELGKGGSLSQHWRISGCQIDSKSCLLHIFKIRFSSSSLLIYHLTLSLCNRTRQERIRNSRSVKVPGSGIPHVGATRVKVFKGESMHLLEQEKDSVAGVKWPEEKQNEIDSANGAKPGEVSQRPRTLNFSYHQSASNWSVVGLYLLKSLPERLCLKLLLLTKLMIVLHRDFLNTRKQLKLVSNFSDHKIADLPLLNSWISTWKAQNTIILNN